MNTMITDYDMTERAIKSGFKLISSRELIENYTDDLIRNLDIMYSDFMVPDIKSYKTLDDLEFPLQADRVLLPDKKDKQTNFKILCTFIGTEPYSAVFGKMFVYVIINNEVYRYTYELQNSCTLENRFLGYKIRHKKREKLTVLMLKADNSMVFRVTENHLIDTPDIDTEIDDYIHDYVISCKVRKELNRRKCLRKYSMYFQYRKLGAAEKTI